MTTMNPIEELGKELINAISSKDVVNTLLIIQQIKIGIGTNADYIVWITTPANLNLVQSALTEHFGIPQKAMMIKPRPGSSRGLRASFFLQAMENSLKRAL